jgi:tripartite-type tricarboxylate transporter receptor subunit TctC
LTPSAAASDFYAGKTITIVVGSDVGGGFDTYARLFSRHLGRFIPGNPSLIVRNMPGAGSAKAAGYVYSVAPQDGTVIGALNPGGLLAPLFEGKDLGYETPKFQFLASADASARLCVTLKDAKVKSFADAQKRKLVVGAAGAGSSSYDYAFLHKNVHNAMFEVVAGYKGMAEILLAMERDEVEAVCGFDWSSLKAQRANLVRDGGFNYLLKVAVQAEPDLDSLGIPDAGQFATNEIERAIGDLVGAQQLFGRPYAVAPGVASERVEILRQAFADTMKDPQFLAEAEKSQLSITPASGAEAQKTVERMHAAPKEVIEGAKNAVRP